MDDHRIKARRAEERRKALKETEDEMRRGLIAKPVTLNGKPAQISGIRNSFATVRTLDRQNEGQWAWPTVSLIVARGGDFRL